MTVIRDRPVRFSLAALAGLFGAAGVGLAAGGTTAYLQGVLSADWNTIANSGAVWTVTAAVVAAVVVRAPGPAAAAGLVTLLGEVAGYYGYVVEVLHLPVLRAEVVLWTLAALWIGPVAGLAAHFVRWGSDSHRLIALLGFGGVVGGEGEYLWRVAGVPAAGIVELVAAAVGSAAALVLVPAPARARLLAAAAGLLVAAAVYVAYSQPLLT
jgi:hypothetical protein